MDSSARPGPGPDREPPERTSGLTLETCYRHADQMTGVHCTRCGRPICPDCMHPAPVGYQCPECVAEARRSGPRRRTITLARTSSLARALIVANVAVFLVSMVSRRSLFELGAMNPLAIADGQYWRLFSAMFLHAGVLHLLLNMYALWLFGTLVESAFGRVRFLAIYFASGLLASVTSFAFAHPRAVAVGASGAIFGLLGAWVAYNFRRRGSAFAAANLRGAATIVAINLVLGFTIPGIDNFAHMGGLVAGGAAGFIGEGFGPRAMRGFVQFAGFAALAVLGFALAALRVASLSP